MYITFEFHFSMDFTGTPTENSLSYGGARLFAIKPQLIEQCMMSCVLSSMQKKHYCKCKLGSRNQEHFDDCQRFPRKRILDNPGSFLALKSSWLMTFNASLGCRDQGEAYKQSCLLTHAAFLYGSSH